jgi:AraC-like DNA-binding protein
VYAIKGEAEYRFGTGEHVNIVSGDILFVFPECAYNIVTTKNFRHYTVNFDIYKESSTLQSFGVSHYLLRHDNMQPPERVFKRLVDIWNQKIFGYEMQATSAFYELLSLLCLNYLPPISNTSKQRLQNAKEYIEKNFDKPIRLEQLAYLSSMSITNFRREWARIYTESPIAYRDSIRMNLAKEYLNCGYYTVTEVARKCGFDDTSYFVRFFKKKAGCTPNEFKKQLFRK